MGEHLFHGYPFGPSASWVEPVAAVATSNVDLATLDYLTTVDGVAIGTSRLLLAAQTDPAENGIWIPTGTAGGAYRAEDFDDMDSASRPKVVVVRRGTQYRGSMWGCFTYGSLGNVLPDETDTHWTRLDRHNPLAPTGAIAETYDRSVTRASDLGVATLVSGELLLTAIPLRAGQPVTDLTFLSGTTALATGSNQWFALYDKNLALLDVTADDTSTAWAANSTKTLTLASPVTPAYDGLHYAGICVVATTVPSLRGILAGANEDANWDLAPALNMRADSGLTNPASAPATATSASTPIFRPYAYAR